MDKLIIQLLKTYKSNNQTNAKYHESNKPKYYGQINKINSLIIKQKQNIVSLKNLNIMDKLSNVQQDVKNL